MSFGTSVAEGAINIGKPVTVVGAGMRALGALTKAETVAALGADITGLGAVIWGTGWLLKQALT